MKNFFHHARKAAPASPPPARVSAAGAPAATPESQRPWPRVDATLAALVGLIVTAFAMTSGADRYGSQIAHTAAVGVLATLLVSFAFEARGGLKNLIRPDLVAIIALFYLTLYEFLFPQPYFDTQISDVPAVFLALWAVIIGFIGLFIGRHLVPRGKQPFEQIMTKPLPAGWLLAILWVSFFMGFLHVLLAVQFDVPKMLDAMMGPRFSQPWGRGLLGGWKELLNEFALLLYLIPPIVGLMLGRRERYSLPTLVFALLAFLWLLFFSFASGTRHVFAAYLITFLIAFTFSSPAERRTQVIVVAALCGGMLMMATKAMLDLRTVGMTRWLEEGAPKRTSQFNSSVFVDYNLVVISKLTRYFPKQNYGRYLGFEIPYIALVRPIPRAIWPGKPKGLSVSIEQALEAKNVILMTTFVGEAYISGGLLAVALTGIVLGMLATFWNRLASPRNSELGILIYSSGFFAMIITMRTCFSLTTAILPSLAGLVFGKFVIPKIREKFKPRAVLPPRLRNRPPAPPPVDS